MHTSSMPERISIWRRLKRSAGLSDASSSNWTQIVHIEQNQIQKQPKKMLLKVSKNFDAKISFANLKVLQVLVFKLSIKSWQIVKGIVY